MAENVAKRPVNTLSDIAETGEDVLCDKLIYHGRNLLPTCRGAFTGMYAANWGI